MGISVCAVSSFPPTLAGVADYGALLTHHLTRDRRIERVTVLADQVPGAPAREDVGGVEVRRVWRRDGVGTGPALLRALRSVRPTVVWFNLGFTMFGTRRAAAGGALVTPLCSRLLGYRTVVTLHELPALTNLGALGLRSGPRPLGACVVPRLLLQVDQVVVTLGRYRRYLMERYGARNVRHIAHGTYGESQCSDEPEQATVLVLGTFGPHKNPGLVAEAISRLRRKRRTIRLVVAGADHPRYPGFMADCRVRSGLDGSWIGYVPADQLGALFARATVVVVPPLVSTGSSGVIYRAMSHGRAVLASDLPDYRGLAEDENLQLAWFESGDPASLANALEALLDDGERRRRIVAHNLEAIQRLGPAQTAGAYVDRFTAEDIGLRRQEAAPAVDPRAGFESGGEA